MWLRLLKAHNHNVVRPLNTQQSRRDRQQGITSDQQVAVAPLEVAQYGVESVRRVGHNDHLVGVCTYEVRHSRATDAIV